MNDFLKFVGCCFVAWLFWMLIVSCSINRVEDVAKDFKESYDEAVESSKNSLELVGNLYTTSSGGYGYYTHYIEGILKNVSGKKLDYAQVSFVIYDSAGNTIGSAFDNISNLERNGTWKFKAIYFGQEPRIKYNPKPEISSW